MFADVALAREIDNAEGRFCAGLARLAALRDAGRRVLVTPLAGGLAVYAGSGTPMNKVIGVGLGHALTEDGLAAVEAEWAVRGEAVRVELSTLDDGAIARMLTSRGYRLLGFENQLARTVATVTGAPEAPPGLSIERLASEADTDVWMSVILDGFAQPDDGPLPTERPEPDVLRDIFHDVARLSGVVRYLARLDGAPAGAASMHLDGRLAQLTGAATLPACRRRGIQTALTVRRLADARARGCDLAVVTTQPGSKSQENCQSRGFELLYARAILVR
jgi:ribosomal protein S18 acetylase RimI-like enzyme